MIPPVDARRLDDEALVRLVLCFHETHLLDLAHALTLAEEAEARHGQDPRFPSGLAEHLGRILASLSDHQRREEQSLRRLMAAPAGDLVELVFGALEREHGDAQDHLERLVRMTGDYQAPADASATWRELYDICRKFDAEFRDHAYLEDRVLFPRLVAAKLKDAPNLRTDNEPAGRGDNIRE